MKDYEIDETARDVSKEFAGTEVHNMLDDISVTNSTRSRSTSCIIGSKAQLKMRSKRHFPRTRRKRTND